MQKDELELVKCFEKLEQDLSELDQIVEWLTSIDRAMCKEFTTDEGINEYFTSPFHLFAGWDFEKSITEVKRNSCNFIVKEMNQLYKNVTFDAEDIWDRFQEAGFYPTAVHSYIHNICTEEDVVALEQIKNLCRQLLPMGPYGLGGSYHRANKPEHIQGKHSMLLHEYVYYNSLYHGTKRIRALVNFTKITLENANPADVEPVIDILNIPGTIIYQDDLISSIRVYKNGNLKIRFRGPAYAEIMCKALTDLVEVH